MTDPPSGKINNTWKSVRAALERRTVLQHHSL
jgi:hypothetical protein